jgi:hypothetical protein
MPRALSGENPADVLVVGVAHKLIKVRMTLKSSIDLTAVNFIRRKTHRLTAPRARASRKGFETGHERRWKDHREMNETFHPWDRGPINHGRVVPVPIRITPGR